ncbi:uncharacterized protein LOC111052559 [Nilaparvata lugens]|uniref:uncharacterized protein LOC111052559 n=1 Tax=Nilaparvata lugens TaxID=108931 RepID=UPI00193E5B68|nr:uncharacterized protein LOC111052559 [Nilaparvata lugens]
MKTQTLPAQQLQSMVTVIMKSAQRKSLENVPETVTRKKTGKSNAVWVRAILLPKVKRCVKNYFQTIHAAAG